MALQTITWVKDSEIGLLLMIDDKLAFGAKIFLCFIVSFTSRTLVS